MWIQTQHVPKVKAYCDQFSAAKPFKYLVIDNFFSSEALDIVLRTLQQTEFLYKESDLFKFKQTNDLKGELQAQELTTYLLSDEFRLCMQNITGMTFKPNSVDVAGTLYEDTDFLLCHDDELENRILAFLLYLEDFEDDEGGQLLLYNQQNNSPTTIATGIVPKMNRFAIFEVTPTSFHEVQEVLVDKQRLALGGWLHANK